jgi:transposase
MTFRAVTLLGPHFVLTPKRYQSGEADPPGRISKIVDASVCEALYQAAHIMLTKPIKGAPGICSRPQSPLRAERRCSAASVAGFAVCSGTWRRGRGETPCRSARPLCRGDKNSI